MMITKMDLEVRVLIEFLEAKVAAGSSRRFRLDVDGGIRTQKRSQVRNWSLEVHRHDMFFEKLQSLTRTRRSLWDKVANGAVRFDTVGIVVAVAAVVDDHGMVRQVLNEVVTKFEVNATLEALEAFGGQRMDR